MHRLRPIRRRLRPRLAARTLRAVEAAFWFLLVVAIGVGGTTALAGLPKLAGLLAPRSLFAAEARSEPKLGLPWASVMLAPFAAPASAAPPAPRLPAIAIVIDDMGSDAAINRRAMALPRAVALSFLPYPVETPMLAREGAISGHDILVHVPMQAESGGENPGPMALRLDLPPTENVRRLDWALARVPGYIGINNHEGSAFTQNRAALVPVAEALYDRHLFFFDSRTTPLSQVVPVARAFGVPSAARDVFLDDVQSEDAIGVQLTRLEKEARVHGVAIAIGHPHAVTMAVLSRWCANLRGYRLVPIADAIRMKTEREMNVAVR